MRSRIPIAGAWWRLGRLLRPWVDNGSRAPTTAIGAGTADSDDRVDWPRIVPFLLIHLGALAAFQVGVNGAAITIAACSYALRMFGITAFYHRYFSHRAFRMSRPMQFAAAVLGNAAAQRGPLWWAAHHRRHHKASDTPADAHSFRHRGFLWSHVGWWTTRRMWRTDLTQVPDLARFRELRWLDRFDTVVPVLFAAATFGLGALLQHQAPSLGLDAWSCLVWGFFVPTVVLYHATFTVNSLSHRFGSQRYATGDDSRNHPILALLTFGEGWHNNHHHYPAAARQGFFWWELDVTYWLLRVLERLGLVADLRPVPLHVRDGGGGIRRRPQ